MANKLYLNWSSGKDAMLALHQLTRQNKSVQKLVTTINAKNDRISMHGISVKLLQQQAHSLNIPLHTISLDGTISLEDYNQEMFLHTQQLKKEGFTHSVFGDIFLEDLRAYREEECKKVNLEPMFPLWQKNTQELVREFISLGYLAVVVCVNANYLDASFCGRIIDEKFLEDLPEGVDPCGENGEFHTFVFDGPLFRTPVNFELGEKVAKEYFTSEGEDCFTTPQSWDHKFWYQDLTCS